MGHATDEFRAGQRVVVTQQIPQRDEVWTQKLEGTVVRFEQRKTGSWFAHAKDDKLWLDRLVVRKDDGEIVICNLDQYSHVDVVGEGPVETEHAGHTRKTEGGVAQPAIRQNAPERRPDARTA